MRTAPTLTFIPDALPETARHIDELLARAKAQDDAVAAQRACERTPAARTRTRSPDAEADEDDDAQDDRPTPAADPGWSSSTSPAA